MQNKSSERNVHHIETDRVTHTLAFFTISL